MLKACEQAKKLWTTARTSQKERGLESYKIDRARRDARLPGSEVASTAACRTDLCRTFEGRMIEADDHPGLLRIVGDKQSVS